MNHVTKTLLTTAGIITLTVLAKLMLAAQQPVSGLQQAIATQAQSGDTPEELAGEIYSPLDKKFTIPNSIYDLNVGRQVFDRATHSQQGNAAGNMTPDLREKMVMAMKYKNGDGIAQNYPQAARLFGEAADQGELHGMFELAKLYYEGNGVPHDLVAAHSLCNVIFQAFPDDPSTSYVRNSAYTMLMSMMLKMSDTDISQSDMLTGEILAEHNVTGPLQRHLASN